MKKWLMAAILPIAILLSSCADEFDVAMVQSQMNAEIEVARAKSAAAIAQSDAISRSLENEDSELARYLARDQIAGITVTESGIKSVTTGNDVVMTLAKDGKVIIRDIVTGAVVYRGIVGLTDALAKSGDTTIHTEGDGNEIDVNQEDVKMIGAGEAQQNYKAGGSGDESGDSSDCDAKVNEALAGYDMENINLGGLMRGLSADTGCIVDIRDEQVVVLETGTPISAINAAYSWHSDLGGGEEPEVE